MLSLDQMLNVELLIKDKKQYRTANIFGFIAYSARNPYVAKVLKDKDFWQSLNARTEGWILYAIKPDSEYYVSGNADYINHSLGLEPTDYPQLVILSIGSNRVMMQRNYPISDESLDDAYKSIEQQINTVTAAVKKILPCNMQTTNVSREVIKALDAELASDRWKRVSVSFAEFIIKLLSILSFSVPIGV